MNADILCGDGGRMSTYENIPSVDGNTLCVKKDIPYIHEQVLFSY